MFMNKSAFSNCSISLLVPCVRCTMSSSDTVTPLNGNDCVVCVCTWSLAVETVQDGGTHKLSICGADACWQQFKMKGKGKFLQLHLRNSFVNFHCLGELILPIHPKTLFYLCNNWYLSWLWILFYHSLDKLKNNTFIRRWLEINLMGRIIRLA